VKIEELFDQLDGDGDGRLSRADLHQGAARLRWHWPEAPLYAVLDHLVIRTPMSRDIFAACVEQIDGDFYGPYGKVLRRSPIFAPDALAWTPGPASDEQPTDGDAAVEDQDLLAVDAEEAALLIIDPQRSFTCGAWKKLAGAGADAEVEPIRAAFRRCGQHLLQRGARVEAMFTRCPFPPDSYEWDAQVANAIDPAQPYFVKPGNSVLWPPTNGFQHWVDDLVRRDKTALVIGGCTLNSCVRVSAVETQTYGARLGLQVVVDLSLCGARASNYLPSPTFGGRSSVAAAVSEMRTAGVTVVARVAWA